MSRHAPTVRPFFHAPRSAPAGQRGIALVVALVLLIVITLVGLAAVRGTIMQQKMTANFYDRQIAFQSDEAALRVAQKVIQDSTAAPAIIGRDCSPLVGSTCTSDPFSDPNLPAAAIKLVTTGDYDAASTVAGTQPQYVIDYMGRFDVPDPAVKQVSNCSGYLPCVSNSKADFFRITVRNGAPVALQNRASVTMQSIFRK